MTRHSQRGRLCVDVLGPVRLVVDGETVDVPGPRRRAVLALLAMAGGRALSVDELLDAVWSDTAPDSGRRALHSHISRLRGHLGAHADRLQRDGNAYRLALEPGELDVDHVRSVAATARAAAADRPAEAVELFAGALAHWRGAALEEFPDVSSLAADAVALASFRRDLVDDWLEARLACAQSGTPALDHDLLADANRALAAAPLRERTACIVLRTLAGEGRVVEAMRAAHAFRTRVVEETGLEPSAAFIRLEQSIAAGELPAHPRAAHVGAAPGEDAPRPTPPAERRPLQRPSGPLVGREHDLSAAHHQLANHALVTVVGPGGVGKTRLALEVAADVADTGDRTVHVVELATVEHESHIHDALAAALDLNTRSPSAVRDAAASLLASSPSLLVIDNCEHLLDACRVLIADLMSRSPSLVVLATSREPLGLAAEQLLRLGPLAVPDAACGVDGLESVPAVAAFLAHARRRAAHFDLDAGNAAVVAEIVRRLDGLPLAVELAAGRVGSLGVGDVRDRLGRALDLLAAGRSAPDSRHRTLRSTIDWSYQLLDEDERCLLRAISLFPGGVDLDGIEHVAGRLGVQQDPAAVTARLVDASVVVVETSTTRSRYRMLETVRSFAVDALEAHGERERAEDALVVWATDLVADIHDLGMGPREAEADRRLATELPNLRAARDVALRRGDLVALTGITLGLDDLSLWRPLPEVHGWAIELATALPTAHPAYTAVAHAAARAAWLQGDFERAARFAGEGSAGRGRHGGSERTHDAIGILMLYRGEYDLAEQYLIEAAEQALPHIATGDIATAALAAIYAGRIDDAQALVARATAMLDDSTPPSSRAFVHYTRGDLLAQHDVDAAIGEYLAAIELANGVGATFVTGVATVGLVSAYGRLGRLREAFDGYRWLVDYWRRAGNWTQMWTTMRNLSRALLDADDPMCAAFVLAAADHAEDASSVDPRTAAEHDALNAQLEAILGAAEMHRIRSRAVALPRTTVVDEALEAVDAALDSAIASGGGGPRGRVC